MAHHVFLSAGHGGSDPGAVGYGMKEKDINLDIMLACKAELERHGVKVTASRTRDEDDPVGQEVREANASGAEIAVSFHTNAGGGDGSESFYYKGSANGKRLAELCEKHVKAIGQNSRGVKTNNLAFTRDTYMIAVLCECAFIDNDRDNDIIDTKGERDAYGVAYAKAILEYLGIAYNGGSKPSQPENPATGGGYVAVVTADVLNIRKGAGTNYGVAGTVRKGEAYTIVAEQAGQGSAKGWGKLKSGAGWVSLDFMQRKGGSSEKTYTVVRGDTLSGIGEKLGVDWRTLASKNGIKSPYIIHAGDKLKY